jgi:hypothetical protein
VAAVAFYNKQEPRGRIFHHQRKPDSDTHQQPFDRQQTHSTPQFKQASMAAMTEPQIPYPASPDTATTNSHLSKLILDPQSPPLSDL